MLNRVQQSQITTAILMTLIVASELLAQSPGFEPQLRKMKVSQLEDRLKEIDNELGSLARTGFRSGVGAIGYRSKAHNSPDRLEWIQVDLESEYKIDDIILVPNILRDSETGYNADAFPREFRVIAGVKNASHEIELATGVEIAAFSPDDRLTPRTAPVVIPCNGIKATWIRIEAKMLASRQFDSKHLLQFDEILVFSGMENVAINQPVTASSNESTGSPAWDKQFIVDGFVPYVMNSATKDWSNAFVSGVGIGDEPTLTIDLESEHILSEIHFHLVDQGDTVPQTFAGDFGVPKQLLVEGSMTADFSSSKTLLNFRHENAYDIGPIICRRFQPTNCRYVRLTAIEPFTFRFRNNIGSRIGFAEIELIADGENVAVGKKTVANFGQSSTKRALETITDGKNRNGRILSTRNWLRQLARRHDLETERPHVSEQLTNRYQRQRTNLNRLITLTAFLGLVGLTAIIGGWLLRQRAVQRTRERIAADLHDELGANIHAIGLLSDLAERSAESPKALTPLLKRIRDLTERTGTATAYCANMLESVGLFDDLEQDMRLASERIMADLEHEIEFEGKEYLEHLKPKKRIDLFLFYKECLANIIRHSGATRVSTKLKASPNELKLSVADNGHGIKESFTNGVPPSLRRRARLLGASVEATSVETGGTRLELRLRLRSLWPLNLL